jgi:hypothetical protein
VGEVVKYFALIMSLISFVVATRITSRYSEMSGSDLWVYFLNSNLTLEFVLAFVWFLGFAWLLMAFLSFRKVGV